VKTTKRRSSPCKTKAIKWWSEPVKGSPLPVGPGFDFLNEPDLTETQVTESENHPGWKTRKPGFFTGDIGGEFLSVRRYTEGIKNAPRVQLSAEQTTNVSPLTIRRIIRVGPILPYTLPQSYPSSNASSNAVLNAWGAKAVAACKPTNPVADVATALAETVREGIPKMIGAALWKDRTRELRKTGADEFLNYQFGLAPLGREIGDAAYAIVSADAIMRQYQRDSGKVVRRRWNFPSEVTTMSTVLTGRTRPFLPIFSASPFNSPDLGRCVREVTTFRRRWFSGAFTYYLPSDGNVFGSMARSAAMARKTLGLSLTPDVIWNLTPWSWAVDWFTNAGDVISNLTSWMVDGLVLHYGYIMEHSYVRETYTWTGGNGYAGAPTPLPMAFVTETKVRRKANPFGFGLTWAGLTPIQLAIAAALGISRS